MTSTRLDSNNYGKQAVAEFLTFSGFTDFTSDVARALNIPSPDTPTVSTTTIHYGTMELRTTFTNQELTTCYLSIYDTIPRFHQSTTAFSPVSTWDLGVERQATPDVEIDTYLNVYQKPFKSEFFTNFHKVLNVQRVELAPGATHSHVFTHHVNRGLLGYKAQCFNVLRNYAAYQMYVVSGTPVNDSANITLVSTSTIALDIVRSRTYNFVYANQLRTRNVNTTALGTITSANVITDTSIKLDSEA